MFPLPGCQQIHPAPTRAKSTCIFSLHSEKNKLRDIAKIKPHASSIGTTVFPDLMPDKVGLVGKAPSQTAVRKTQRIHDQATDKYYEVVEFPTSLSTRASITLLPAVVSEPSMLEKELRNAGAILPKEASDLKELLEAVAKSDAPKQRIYAERTGWTEDGKVFVLLDGAIGDSTGRIIGVKLPGTANDRSGERSVSGNWQNWRDSVAQFGRHSTILMLAICVPLAAPLLAIINHRSFSINLVGRTRSGKTIATVAAASVIGTAREADLITWNITDARLEQRLVEFNDSLFPIDDLTGMRSADKARYQRIRDVTYKITQGWSTGRFDSFTSVHEGAHRDWTCILLTSNEKPTRELANSARMERQHGEALRLIDVPALFDGQDHIFDRPPADIEKSGLDAWKKAAFAKIASSCEEHHGGAWRMYIEALIAQRPTLKDYAEQRISFFEQHASDELDGNVARDVLRKFGLLYAGGMLGIKCGLVPWDKKLLLKAITKAYQGARELLPDDGVLLRLGIAKLREKLKQLPSIPEPTPKSSKILNFEEMDGYRQKKANANHYVLKRESFNKAFSSAEQETLVIAWLIEKKRVTLSAPIQGHPTPEPRAQFTWPDGERRRSIEIVWPLKQPQPQKKGKTKKKGKGQKQTAAKKSK
jgi:hypothetical protein